MKSEEDIVALIFVWNLPNKMESLVKDFNDVILKHNSHIYTSFRLIQVRESYREVRPDLPFNLLYLLITFLQLWGIDQTGTVCTCELGHPHLNKTTHL